jgi:hypothetical protein
MIILGFLAAWTLGVLCAWLHFTRIRKPKYMIDGERLKILEAKLRKQENQIKSLQSDQAYRIVHT